MSFSTGDVLAEKYRIVRMIGRGGVGEVYEGENLRIRRKVAIKTLRSEFLAKSDVVQRFEREAQAAGRIGSAHIVEVLDLGDLPDGSRYLVMEFLEGLTLSKHIKGAGRLGSVETAQLLVQLLEGLGAAHTAGIVHRDLKPANIVLTSKAGDHFVKILDFGVSKFNTLASDELAMTKTGMVVGTPHYMAPEQAKGARGVDGRADLYAVGGIAYECVTGQVPFSAQTFNELLFKIVLETPPPIESFVTDLDPDFASIVRKAMAREPNQRFQTAADLQQALSDWLVRVTGGKLGTTLAQTASFEGGGSTMILDVGAPRAMQPAPTAAPQSNGPGPPPLAAPPPLPASPLVPAAWPAGEGTFDPHQVPPPAAYEIPRRSGAKTGIAIGAIVVALVTAGVAGAAIFRSGDTTRAVATTMPAASAVPAADAPSTPSAPAAPAAATAEPTAETGGVVIAEPTAPPSTVPTQRPMGGPATRPTNPPSGAPSGGPPRPPGPPAGGAPKPGASAPKSGRTISGDL